MTIRCWKGLKKLSDGIRLNFHPQDKKSTDLPKVSFRLGPEIEVELTVNG
jgi:hypothetical protein